MDLVDKDDWVDVQDDQIIDLLHNVDQVIGQDDGEKDLVVQKYQVVD